MQNDDQPGSSTNPNGNPPNSPPSLTARRQKVIQPSPGLVEELQAQRQQEAISRPAPQPVPSPVTSQSEPMQNTGRPVDPSKIYPDVRPHAAPTDTALNSNQSEAPPATNQRVAARVPALQVYAFLRMIYSTYTLVTLFGLFHSMHFVAVGDGLATTNASSFVTPLLIAAFGYETINILIGVYLLMAKNIKMVSAVLTAFLIIGGISFLRSLVSTVQIISHVSIVTVVSLLISGGLLLYLWNVKSQVDLAAD